MTVNTPRFGRRPIAALVLSLTAGLVCCGQTLAKCGEVPPAKPTGSVGRFSPALYRPGADGLAAIPVVDEDWYYNRSIVGLWEFEVHLKGAQNGLPDNALFDWGLATWHEDNTEIQFSAGRLPSAGDVCMGAWKQVGKAKFKLHHIALGLTPPTATGTFVGPSIIRAEVGVDGSGDTYSGTYTLATYAGSPEDGTEFNESGTPLVMFVGTITAKRVKVY
jgi:hypothetical protein